MLELHETGEIPWPPPELSPEEAATALSRVTKYAERRFQKAPPHGVVLRGRGWIGLVPIGSGRVLRLKPKLPVRRIFELLSESLDLKSLSRDGIDTVEAERLQDLSELLIRHFASLLLRRVRHGLASDYVECEEEGLSPRGRIEVARSLELNGRAKSTLAYAYDDRTADTLTNRVFLATANQLARHPALGESSARAIRTAQRRLEPFATLAPVRPADCIDLLAKRPPALDAALLELCLMFLTGFSGSIAAGPDPSVPFVVSMPRVFEDIVRRRLEREAPKHGWKVGVQHIERIGDIDFKMDLVLRDAVSGAPIAVLDTKYKHPTPQPDDVQQVVAYAATLRVRDAFLIYPSACLTSTPRVAGDIRVHVVSMDLASPAAMATESLIRSLKRCVEVGQTVAGAGGS